jgi:hypothetical protein
MARPIACPRPDYPTLPMQDAQFKALFGLRPEDKWPMDGLPCRTVQSSTGPVIELWVAPLKLSSRQGKPRLMARCGVCSHVFGAGRIQQHYETCARRFKVIWDNGHACDSLPGRYLTRAEAERAGQDWHQQMVAIDPNPNEAREAYSFEVVEA